MPVYAKKVQRSHPVFHNRKTVILGASGQDDWEIEFARIPIPDSVTLCNGCNQNTDEGYLVYLGKRELKADHPYDYYCEPCLKSYFKGAIIVGGS